MIPVGSGVRVWLAVGRTDMRRGMNGLALQVQETLGRDPFAGDLFVFRVAVEATTTTSYATPTSASATLVSTSTRRRCMFTLSSP
jgi:transposase